MREHEIECDMSKIVIKPVRYFIESIEKRTFFSDIKHFLFEFSVTYLGSTWTISKTPDQLTDMIK